MKINKLFKKLISFAMAAVLIAGGMTGFTTAKAAEIPTGEESINSVYGASYRFSFTNVGTDGRYATRTDLGGTSITLASSRNITISFGPASGSEAIVEILNTNGAKIDTFHIPVFVSGSFSITLPAGTYQFRVHANSGTTSGGFTVTVN